MKRELVAAALIPVLVATILWAPAWALLALLGVATLLAADELLGMARGSGVPVGRAVPLALVGAVLAAAWTGGPGPLGVALVGAAVILPVVQLGHRDRPSGALAAAAANLFTVVYLGGTASCLGWIRLWPDDPVAIRLVLLFLFAIWVGDSGAYYVGKTFGRHRMSPRISPNKTWEGLAGGVAATFGAVAVLEALLGLHLGWAHTFALAAILAVAAPVGDLVESLFKRDTGVKDSSGLLPGHGGLLDRTDSLFFTAPPVLAYLVWSGLVS